MKDNIPPNISDQNNDIFRNIFKTHNAIMLLIDPEEGKILEANNAASLFYGYSIEELCSMSIDQINTMPAEEIRFERLRAKEMKRNFFLFQHRLKNDEIRSVEVHSTPVNIGEKKILFSIIHDISDRVLISEKLKQSEEYFRSLIENSNDVISILDDNGNIVYESSAHERVLGYATGELIGTNVFKLVHPDDQKRIEKQFVDLLKNPGETVPVNFRFKDKKGKFKFLEGAGTNLLHTNAVRGIVVNYRDVTDRKEFEEKIRRVASEWQSTFDAISDSVSIIDLEGTILQYNIATLSMFGLNESEIKEKKCFELVHGLTDHYPDCPLVRIRESGKSESMEFEENGRWLKVTVDPIYSEKGELNRCVHVVENISENKKSEKLLIESKQFVESMVNLSPDILYIYDIEAKKNIYSNDGIESVLGYTAQQIKDMGDQLIPKLMHPEDYKIYLGEILPRYAAARDNESIEHQYRMKNIDGEWHWLNSREIIYRRDPDGIPIQIFGVVQDVTEQKKNVEEILRLKEGLEIEVEKKTRDLNEKVSDLQRFVDATVERELRMKDLYEENEKLKTELKKKGKNS